MTKLYLKIQKTSGKTVTDKGGGQTVTLFRKKKDSQAIEFHNDSDEKLSVVFDPVGVVEDADGNKIPNIDVTARDKQEVFVTGASAGQYVKYTAKIGNSNAEDPIIILD